MPFRRLTFEGIESRLALSCTNLDEAGMCPGDANLDGTFDSEDIVHVFTFGEYDDGIPGNSTWSEGDWNGDREFDSEDLVHAFQFGNYTAVDVLYPDVLAVDLQPTGTDTYRVSVTLSSPYDRPERYADAWRVLAPDGTTLGTRILTHDHQHEQPFTRSLSGVLIPAGVDEVTVQGRDQLSGWGGQTLTVAVPRTN